MGIDPHSSLSFTAVHGIIDWRLELEACDSWMTGTGSIYVPSWSASRRPRSADTTLSYSRSHLLPTSTTCALSHEYVLICVHLRATTTGIHPYAAHPPPPPLQSALRSIIKHGARHAISTCPCRPVVTTACCSNYRTPGARPRPALLVLLPP